VLESSGDPQHRRWTELAMMRWGMPPPPRTGGPLVTKYQEHQLAALAQLAEPGEPLSGAVQQLRRMRA